MDTFNEVLADVAATKIFGWDLECDSESRSKVDTLNPRKAIITHVAIASLNKGGCWEATPEVLEGLATLLRNEHLYALVYNALYDHAVLHHSNVIKNRDIRAKAVDVLGLAWLIDEEDKLGLKYVVKKYLNIKMTSFEDVVKNSSAAQALGAIDREHAQRVRVLNIWRSGKTPKRPWPTWTDEPKSKTAVSRALRIANPALSSKEATADTLKLFSEEYVAEYEAFITKQVEKNAPKREQALARINEHMKKYATADAVNLVKLFRKLIPILKKEGTAHVLKHEMAVRFETINMAIEGMPIDRNVLSPLSTSLHELIDQFEAEIYELAGEVFSINSANELREILFFKFELNPPTCTKVFRTVDNKYAEQHLPDFTPTGQKLFSSLPADIRNKVDARDVHTIPEDLRRCLRCDAKMLERLAHPIAQAILNYKTAAKLLSTYVDSTLVRLDNAGIDVLYGTFNSWGTKTGRFSSKEPNLQNIPSRGKGRTYHEDIQRKGPEIRKAFVAKLGHKLLVFDHSQIELRIIAHLANETNLLNVYRECVRINGIPFYTGDVHSSTAKSVGCSRSAAKAVNFGFNYGMGAIKYARQNSIFKEGTFDYDIEKCADFRTGYFKSYPRILELMDYLKEVYDSGVRVFPTIGGRWRHFYNNDRGIGRAPTKGTILNSCVQGGAADILKYVIYIIVKHVYPRYPGMQLIGQVHDEIIFTVPEAFAEEAAVLVKYAMEYPWYPLACPILSSGKILSSWGGGKGDAPEVGTFYAKVDKVDRLFTADTWDEYLKAEKEDKVSLKASCAQLMPKQVEWCRTIIPDDLPPSRPSAKRTIMTREEQMKVGIL